MAEEIRISEASTKEEKQVTMTIGGTKYDGDKPRFDLIPPEPLFELAQLYAIGAKKYSTNNWRKGMSWGRVFAAMMRHAWAFWKGEAYDRETGIHHLIAVVWNAIALYHYSTNKMTQFDDRPGRSIESSFSLGPK